MFKWFIWFCALAQRSDTSDKIHSGIFNGFVTVILGTGVRYVLCSYSGFCECLKLEQSSRNCDIYFVNREASDRAREVEKSRRQESQDK